MIGPRPYVDVARARLFRNAVLDGVLDERLQEQGRDERVERIRLDVEPHDQTIGKACLLDFVSKYLEIEQTRFADRLVVRFDIEPETLDALVPTLLLQPLVENAIKHGISKKSGPGHIDIRARPDHGKLWIEVRDDGCGLSETALIAMQKGIGVSTTRARLQHQFGADFRFEFHRLEEGVAVVVVVPWRTEPRTAEDDLQVHDDDTPVGAHRARLHRTAIGAMDARARA